MKRVKNLSAPMELNGHSHLLTGALPNAPGPEFRIIQLGAAERAWGVILCDAVWGVVTHWDQYQGKKGRSSRCTLDKSDSCAGCENQLPSRWKGYIHYWCLEDEKEKFLEITPAAFKALVKQAPTKGTLRGIQFEAKRTPGGAQGRLRIHLSLFAGDMEDMPAKRDPEPILEVLWGWRPGGRLA